MTQENRLKLLDFTLECDKLRKKLLFGTTALTPLNFEEEKNRFFTSQSYNPVYVYKKIDFTEVDIRLRDLSARLRELKIPSDLRFYLLTYIEDLNLLEKTKKSIGTNDFAYHARKLFSFPDFDAETFLNSLPKFQFADTTGQKLYTADEIAEVFRHILHNKYGLTHFVVNVDTQRPYIIWTGTSNINIGSAVKRFEANVHRLVVHEIESHALQSYNLSHCTNPFMRLANYSDSNLYGEGLAVFNEVKSGTITEKAYSEYEYRVRAVGMLDNSFRDIYNYLRGHIAEHRAFLLTYRVKRGMRNTALPGGFPKDASYLFGYKTIIDYINAGLNPEFLYISKNPYLTSLLLSENLLSQDELLFPKFFYKPTIPLSGAAI